MPKHTGKGIFPGMLQPVKGPRRWRGSSGIMEGGERLEPYDCHDHGRPGTDPVVFKKMVLIQHLFGIPSLRQTYREIQVNVAYRWFLGYRLLDETFTCPQGKTLRHTTTRQKNAENVPVVRSAECVIHHRGLARVTSWVRLTFAAMNLKKLAIWSCKAPVFPRFFSCFFHSYAKTPVLALRTGVLYSLPAP